MPGPQIIVPKRTFICRNGHEFRLEGPFVMALQISQYETLASNPACPLCYLAWFSTMFPAVDVTDLEPQKREPLKLEPPDGPPDANQQ